MPSRISHQRLLQRLRTENPDAYDWLIPPRPDPDPVPEHAPLLAFDTTLRLQFDLPPFASLAIVFVPTHASGRFVFGLYYKKYTILKPHNVPSSCLAHEKYHYPPAALRPPKRKKPGICFTYDPPATPGSALPPAAPRFVLDLDAGVLIYTDHTPPAPSRLTYLLFSHYGPYHGNTVLLDDDKPPLPPVVRGCPFCTELGTLCVCPESMCTRAWGGDEDGLWRGGGQLRGWSGFVEMTHALADYDFYRCVEGLHGPVRPRQRSAVFRFGGRARESEDVVAALLQVEYGRLPPGRELAHFRDQREDGASEEIRRQAQTGQGSGKRSRKQPSSCPICGKMFAFPCSVDRHVANVHCGDKVHQCSSCPMRFGQASNLKRHISLVHERRREFPCTFCGERYSLKQHLKQHILRLHPSKQQPLDVRRLSDPPPLSAK